MANPLKEVSVFDIVWSEHSARVVTSYSRSGSVLAYWGYNDKPCARAGGYGYDKTHTALSSAIGHITGLKADNEESGGFDAVAREWRKQGVKITRVI